MIELPPDHAERYLIAEEVHARPPRAVGSPARASYLAVLVAPEDRERERVHMAALCERHGQPAPAAGTTHFNARIGPMALQWERHGEFSGYTFFLPGVSRVPFVDTPFRQIAPGWLAAIPGRTIVGAHLRYVDDEGDARDPETVSALFDSNPPIGSMLGAGAGIAFTDFRVHEDGCSRFLLVNRSFSEPQAGRMIQRLFEIEAYRTLALLALPIARRMAPRIQAIGTSLALLTDSIAKETGADEDLLHELTRLAAEVESGLSATQFRFGACNAYHQLVLTRTAELREERLPGIQTIEEFMSRRLLPAVATCATVANRLHALSDRVSQASSLLSTRVGIAREKQNQALLSSMDRRAKLQLRLQQTVEGLSVAAITYYIAGLLAYLAKGLKAGGLDFNPELAIAIAIPIIIGIAFYAIRRARHKLR